MTRRLVLVTLILAAALCLVCRYSPAARTSLALVPAAAAADAGGPIMAPEYIPMIVPTGPLPPKPPGPTPPGVSAAGAGQTVGYKFNLTVIRPTGTAPYDLEGTIHATEIAEKSNLEGGTTNSHQICLGRLRNADQTFKFLATDTKCTVPFDVDLQVPHGAFGSEWVGWIRLQIRWSNAATHSPVGDPDGYVMMLHTQSPTRSTKH